MCLYTVPVNWIKHFDCFDSTANEQQLTLQLLALTWNDAVRWTLYIHNMVHCLVSVTRIVAAPMAAHG